MTRQALARHTVGVTHGNRAAVDVQAISRDAQLVAAIQHLNRKRFVQFPQVDVVDREAQTCQRFGHGVHRANAHFVRLATGHGKTKESAQRLHAALLSQFFIHQHASACAVRKLAGIASGHQATWQCRAQTADGFDGGAFAQTFVHTHGDLFGGHAHDLVDHALRDGDRGNFVVEQAGSLRSTRFLLTGRTVSVHHIAADLVALGHLFGGL